MAARTSFEGLKAQIRRANRAAIPGAKIIAHRVTNLAVNEMARIAPKDTNRYARAWQQAGNEAMGIDLPLLPIVKSGREEQYRARLERQLNAAINRANYLADGVRYWEKEQGRLWSGSGRKGERAKEATRILTHKRAQFQKAMQVLQRAEETAQNYTGTDVVIGGRGRRGGKGAWRGAPVKLTELTSIRQKVYGGIGRTIFLDRSAMVTLINLEPHAIIVERRSRVLKDVIGRMKSFGIRGVRPEIAMFIKRTVE